MYWPILALIKFPNDFKKIRMHSLGEYGLKNMGEIFICASLCQANQISVIDIDVHFIPIEGTIWFSDKCIDVQEQVYKWGYLVIGRFR